MRAPLALAAALLTACAADPDPADSDSDASTTDAAGAESFALASLSFVREAGGVSDGFDLDGAVGGCDIADFTHPDGTAGVDNSLGPMVPLIEQFGGQAFEELIQRAVVEGAFQFVFSWQAAEGACRDFSITRTFGSPMASVDGRMMPGQTLDPHPTIPPISLDCTVSDTGVVRAEGFELPLELQIFSTEVNLPLRSAIVEIRPEPGGGFAGVIAGGIPVSVLADFVANLDGIGSELPGVLNNLVSTRGDLPGEDGECSRMSAAVKFTTLPAFVFDEPPPLPDTDAEVAP